MSARSFRSVFMVASCAGAALGCYLVSLRVASERAALEEVETQIVLAQRDIRLLQTEIGTRGRLAQLERWNVKVLALSAPSADQFVNGGFELARMVAPEKTPAVEAPVVLASAPADAPRPQLEGQGEADDADRAVPTKELLRTASLKQPQRENAPPVKLDTARRSADPKKAAAPSVREVEKGTGSKAPEEKKLAGKAGPKEVSNRPPTAQKKTVDKPAVAAAKPMTKPGKVAKSDPLAPLPAKKKSASAKDSGPAR